MILKFNNFIDNLNDSFKERAILFYGNNIGKIDYCIKALVSKKKQNSKVNVIHKYTDEMKPGDIEDVIEKNSGGDLFGNNTLVILHLYSEKLSKEIMKNLSNIKSKSLLLIIRSQQLNPNSLIRKHFEQAKNLSIVPCYEETLFEKKKIIENFFESENINVSENFKLNFCRRLSNHRVEIENELKKVFFLSNGNPNQIESFAFTTDSAYFDEQEFLNSIVLGSVINEFDSKFDQLCLIYTDQISFTTILLNHFYKMFKIKSFLADGVSKSQAISFLKPPIFFKYRLSFEKQLDRWSIEDIEIAIRKLLIGRKKFLRGDISANSYFQNCILEIVSLKFNSTFQ